MAAKIKKGDKVVVLAGRDKGKSGEVIQVVPKEGRAFVRGVNLVKRHTKKRRSTCRISPLLTPRMAKPPASASRFWMTAARFASPSVRET
jgi:ribosomal protein L14E/L6E/L27E